MINTLVRCPGMYCGRNLLPTGNWSQCEACPRGFRSNESSACVPCEDFPMFYDWLYLGFMALLALVLHWFCIDMVAMRRNITKEVVALHLSALVEIVGASLITLQLTEPIGSFNITSCKARRLSDWYTLLHNPNPDYEKTLHCTQEAVYPLYTMVFIFYALGIVLMLLIRPLIAKKFLPKQGKFSIYAALYFFPILAMLHAIGGGLIFDEITGNKFDIGHKKRSGNTWPLASAWIWSNSSGYSQGAKCSPSDAYLGSIAGIILHSYCSIHRSQQTSRRINNKYLEGKSL
ncbi:JNK1/MAPK8-associated membrane protein isoform X2 [Neodiprion virginianus]|uniref:JNK1/MAPK8-associated membrane protein isoform X2 n=1 Tax=Neodiprion fabricii TaxID=2872261 RepID=UPI001ED8ED6D|nr:JNK1/MAPK8-associated membrane protein isoform X2 [Neodiprion fabricii]XP_046616386.1 JNK1/MAPK8-associated membrane protein isoform X2 [Neodiprion virginianus]